MRPDYIAMLEAALKLALWVKEVIETSPGVDHKTRQRCEKAINKYREQMQSTESFEQDRLDKISRRG